MIIAAPREWFDRTRMLARQGFVWWGSELWQMLPSRIRRVATAAQRVPTTLEFDPHRVVIRGGEGASIAPLILSTDEAATADASLQVAAAVKRDPGAQRTAVVLSPALIFDTILKLPLQAERSLAAILQHQLGRLVPMDPATLCLGYQVLSRDAAANTMAVAVVVAKRAQVERALGIARSLGLLPQVVVAAAPEHAGTRAEEGGRIRLWRAATEASVNLARRRIYRGIELAAVLLLLGGYAVHIYHLERLRHALQMQVTEATAIAKTLRQVTGRVAKIRTEVNALATRNAAPSPLAVLDDLSGRLPDNTWLAQFSYHNGTAEIVGLSGQATALAAQIEASPYFRRPQLKAPITLAVDGKSERFDIGFDVLSGLAVEGKK